MGRVALSELDEVPAFERQQRAAIGDRKGKHVGIRNRLVGPARLHGREDIVAKATQLLNRGQRKVLVGVQPCHSGVLGAGSNQIVDLSPTRLHVGPCVGEILGAKRREALKEGGLAQAEPPVLLEHPDRNARADDAGLAPADAWRALDTGEGAPDMTRDGLEQLRLLAAGEIRQQSGDILERV